MVKTVWISLDPIFNKIDFYPAHIAKQIENEYSKRTRKKNIICKLENFFNATIHLDSDNHFYQTTPSSYLGRGNYKPPGYRNVKRIELFSESNIYQISIKTYKSGHDSWRICNILQQSQEILNEVVPDDVIIESGYQIITSTIENWRPDDFNNEDNLNKNVIAWHWCLGTHEKNNNLFNLDSSWWIPYLFEQNEIIENAFCSNLKEVEIVLPKDNSKRIIYFSKENSTFASQNDIINGKCRIIKRCIVKIKDLVAIFEKQKKQTEILDSIDLSKYDLNSELIPYEFICPITQDIMENPVTTSDGFNYESTAIQQWFENNSKSPLTGLYLDDKNLKDNELLKSIIQAYLKNKN